jgi:hypothetical protein
MPCRQFNFLGDLLVLDDTGCTHASHRQHTAAAEQSHALYYRELPLDLIHETVARGCGLYMTLEFNWGEILDDVMQIERHPEPGREDYRFLHPILRLYRGAVEGEPTQVRQHHVVEDLFGTYRHDGPSAGTRETVSISDAPSDDGCQLSRTKRRLPAFSDGVYYVLTPDRCPAKCAPWLYRSMGF